MKKLDHNTVLVEDVTPEQVIDCLVDNVNLAWRVVGEHGQDARCNVPANFVAWLLQDYERLQKFRDGLNILRRDEGSSVTLICDNPDFNGQPNCAIEVNGEWTLWETRRFPGDTLDEAIALALVAYRGFTDG